MRQPPILIVDDEEGIRTVLSISLIDSGYIVHSAPDVDSALDLFKANHHPIVITDIKMPGKTGIDLLREIKSITPETEVIMISGHGDIDLAIQSLKNDASDFITKPINEDVLAFALKRAMERIRMRQELKAYTQNLEQMVAEKTAHLVRVERKVAACQLFKGLTSNLNDFTSKLDNLSVFNQMPMFVSIHNRDMKVVAVNHHYKKRLGDYSGKDSWAMYEKLKDKNDSPVARTVITGETSRTNHVVRCINKNKLSVIVDTVPITGADNNVEMVLEFMVDLHEAKQLREELRTTRHKYQQLFDQSPCYISVQDRDLNILSTNARFRESFGNLENNHCYEKLMHRSSPCTDCPLNKTFEDGETHQHETVVTNLDGEQVNILIWCAPIHDADGNITQAIEMFTDITHIRKLQGRLTSLGLLLGSTAHGIKGLLTGIDGAIYRLGAGLKNKDFERVQDGFNDLEFLTDRVKKTVLDILYYTKKRELNWKIADGANFATSTYESIIAKAETKNIDLILEMSESLGTFKADVSILASALGNLLENAVDACCHNEPDNPGKVLFKVYANPNQIAFQITDNGVGMDRETREKLFTLFFSSKGTSGTGLGLYIANEIVQQHGGTITVESQMKQGSTFTVCIPRELSVQL